MMPNKLIKHIYSNIYRDGGSLDGKWIDNDENEWIITLEINSLDNPNEIKTFKLYNCDINEIENHTRIIKESIEHEKIVQLIEKWMIENNVNLENLKLETKNGNRLFDLIFQLRKGNY